MKRKVLILLLLVTLLVTLTGAPAQADTAVEVKELNLVFLHGANSTSWAMQLLSDIISIRIKDFIYKYETSHPGVKIVYDSLNRCYPNNVDIDVWANNIATSCKSFFHDDNLILIGHSMGGKTALYATANDIGGLQDMVKGVITINSPVRNLNHYYFTGGGDYWSAAWLIPQDHGVIGSLEQYDAGKDGTWVAANKHWLAFCSAEFTPTSPQFDISGTDVLPRDMDDKIVPISAQYAKGADIVYYGEHGHSDFVEDPVLASYLAENILRYIFGGTMEYSVLRSSGSYEHQAGWFPVSYNWNDLAGEFPAQSGTIIHKNNSAKWVNYEDIVGWQTEGTEKRSSFKVKRTSFSWLSAVRGAEWVSPEDDHDERISIRTRAAPWSTVKVDWVINGFIEPETGDRSHYEVSIKTGTPFTSVDRVNWASVENEHDFRLNITSQAEGPLRYFEVSWKTFFKIYRSQEIISELAVTAIE